MFCPAQMNRIFFPYRARHHTRFRQSLNAVDQHIRAQLKAYAIQPTAQRLAIAATVLHTDRHPSADEVFETVNREFPTVSRATVYNTLNLFVEKGLCRTLTLREGRIVYDPNMAPHHHLLDEESGRIYDLPWDALEVTLNTPIEGFDVTTMEVVVRANRRNDGMLRRDA